MDASPSFSGIKTARRSEAGESGPDASAIAGSEFRGKKIHFIGIGGCGMSGLANIVLDAGAAVTGSEPRPNEQTFALGRRGAKISREQMGELLDRSVDLVVRTAAVPDTNLEYLAARSMGIPTLKYAQMLGRVMAERFGVAVAGTHGKSTTTAMIAFALMQGGMEPSFVVGGTAAQIGGGSRSGTSRLFVAEACEYDRSFHNLHPRVAIVTNIDNDHLDCYADIEAIIDSFREFARLVPANGLIIGGGTDPRVIAALAGASAAVELVGLSSGFAWSTRPMELHDGCPVGEVSYKGKPVGILRLKVAGEHNLLNATMAAAACAACGMEPAAAIEALGEFLGVDRRMTLLGKRNGAWVVDDYGHHPTEIRATLKALRERYQPRRLFCVFQPHQFSRTRILLEEFARSFDLADETIVPDIYSVRDSAAERQRVSSEDLVKLLQARGRRAIHLPGFDDIVAHLAAEAGEGDLVLTIGAGNVRDIGIRFSNLVSSF